MTERQKKFIVEYLASGNAAESARRAGYSPRCANRQGYALMANETIRAAINEKLRAIENARTADVQEILEYLTSVLRGETTETLVTPNGKKIEVPSKSSERLRAAYLLLKVHGAFRDKQSEEDNAALVVEYISTLAEVWSEPRK